MPAWVPHIIFLPAKISHTSWRDTTPVDFAAAMTVMGEVKQLPNFRA